MLTQDQSIFPGGDKTAQSARLGQDSLLPGFNSGDFRFLSLKEISEIFGRDVNEVARLVREGLPVAGYCGKARRFDLVRAAAWFIRYLQGQLDRTMNSPTLKAARQSLLEVQVQREQLALEKERGRLIDVGVLEGELCRMTTTLREQLLLLPARVGPDLGLADQKVAQLRSEVEGILNQLSGKADVEQSLVGLMHAVGGNRPSEETQKMQTAGVS